MKEANWLSVAGVRTAHAALIAEHGGADGIRDEGLLQSALARPRNLLAYGEPTIFALAAAYGFGIARNHPFVDGNKRTALIAIVMFLLRNDHRLMAPEAEAVVVIRDLAAGALSEDELARWIEVNTRAVA